jgi:hypothetical protein
MNSYSERHDNPRFRKTLKRDFFVLMVVSMTCAAGIVLVLWAASKGIID